MFFHFQTAQSVSTVLVNSVPSFDFSAPTLSHFHWIGGFTVDSTPPPLAKVNDCWITQKILRRLFEFRVLRSRKHSKKSQINRTSRNRTGCYVLINSIFQYLIRNFLNSGMGRDCWEKTLCSSHIRIDSQDLGNAFSITISFFWGEIFEVLI